MAFTCTKAQSEFITVWEPGRNSSTISGYNNSSKTQIYCPGIGTNYTIYWEEVGNASHNATLTNVNSNLGHPVLINFGTSSATTPKYTVKVSNRNGNFTQIAFANVDNFDHITYYGDASKILSVSQWGNIQWGNMSNAFAGCVVIDITATNPPNLSNVTDLSKKFYSCNTYFVANSSFANWNTSNITNMSGMFKYTSWFNQIIGNWDTSTVTDMSYMFSNTSFNQNIGNWNTANITGIRVMFKDATIFNQNIGNWNTSKVTNMFRMFYDAYKFNQISGVGTLQM